MQQEEVRIALVMYGGVSLGVYMSGVAQEFFHLVRATAPNRTGEASGAEAVYRELGQIANSRFVADILSGSSAGGINAIFLAKALANGQNIDRLSRLWIEEADVRRLWNRAWRPRGILSGEALSGMLRRALDGMDAGTAEGALQPEIDVFVTATDLQGLELPLPLAEDVVEKSHEQVFHFRFGREGNDFAAAGNPTLGFAARATSSFPFAFEPARLGDRAFADGGLLNNKPFNYALGQIPARISETPGRRLLMYVEPAPEWPGVRASRGGMLEALLRLRQRETIREDLRQLRERNRLVERVREITAQVERDVEHWREGGHLVVRRLTGLEYAKRTLSEEIHARGPGYAGYHRLKVRAVTDDLARVSRLPRAAVEEWRRKTYREEDPSSSESLFLLHFDLGYRQRRLRFLVQKSEELPEGAEVRRGLARAARSLADVRVDPGDMDAIRSSYGAAMVPAAEHVERCVAGTRLQRYFEQYEDYDQVTFPVCYETQVGEIEPVEVFRLSPLDARSLIDEASPRENRRKLAGTAFFRFAAFLKRSWRENDWLWGRLDAAERIIVAVLASRPAEARKLVRVAHVAILREYFGDQAEAMYVSLRDGYDAGRGLGCMTAVLTAMRVLWITFRMLVSL